MKPYDLVNNPIVGELYYISWAFSDLKWIFLKTKGDLAILKSINTGKKVTAKKNELLHTQNSIASEIKKVEMINKLGERGFNREKNSNDALCLIDMGYNIQTVSLEELIVTKSGYRQRLKLFVGENKYLEVKSGMFGRYRNVKHLVCRIFKR